VNPAQTLRAASDRLRALDRTATPGPWIVTEDYDDLVLATVDALDPDGDGLAGSYHCTDRVAAHDFTIYDEDSNEERQVRAAFALISALRPVAAPLADQFQYLAEFVEKHYGDDDFPETSLPVFVHAALPVARAVLREAQA